MYVFKIDINKLEYDTFVSQNKYCNLLQSYNWTKIKSNWDHLYTGVYKEGKLVATGLVLIKRLPLSFSMFYIPRGPIMDYKDKELVQYYFEQLKKIAKKEHCLFIKLDPSILVSSFHLDEERKELEYKEEFENILSCGAIHYGFNKDFETTIQPRFHMVEYAQNFGMDFLTKKGKKNIKVAQKQNLDIQFGGIELLDDFNRVMKCTEERKGISLRTKEYYKLLLDTYKEDAFIALAYFHIQDMLNESKDRYEKCLNDLSNCPENAKKKRFTLEELKASLEKKIDQYQKDVEKYGNTVCVCGTLSVKYGHTSEILYAGMNEEFKRLMGPYLTWYKTMEYCFSMGCQTSNMGGVEGNLKGGLVDFKEIYYPRINEYIGEFDIPVNNFLYNVACKEYKKTKAKNIKHN